MRKETLFRFLILYSTILFITYHALSQQPENNFREINKTEWEKIVKGKDYTEATIDKPELQEIDPPMFTEVSPAIKILLYILVIVLLLFILFKIFGKYFFKEKANIKLPEKLIIRDLDEKPMESDLTRYLKEALEMRDYNLAIRIYYLFLLKTLHEKKVIRWKKSKTNVDYSKEISGKNYEPQFSSQTLLYEYIWYGENTIDEIQFNKIKPGFESLIKKIEM